MTASAAPKSQIIAGAERVFDLHGFAASGMDTLTAAAGVSSRTLYKHMGSKTGLTVAVLEARMSRFFDRCEAGSIDELFVRLEDWVRAEGSRGCLFLRAQGEAGENPAIAEVVARYRQRLRDMLARIVAVELGRNAATAPTATESTLSTAVLVLFEGATSAASYLGVEAISTSRSTASTLLDRVRAES